MTGHGPARSGGRRSAHAVLVAALAASLLALPDLEAAAAVPSAGLPTAAARSADSQVLDTTAEVAPAEDFEALAEIADDEGRVRVLVDLQMRWVPEGLLTMAAAEAQRTEIRRQQGRIRSAVAGQAHRVVHEFEHTPGMALELSRGALDALNRSNRASGIVQDAADAPIEDLPPEGTQPAPAPPEQPPGPSDPPPVAPALTDTTPLIGAAALHDYGHRGNGRSVAVLDTGVQPNHPYLSGGTGSRVTSEACYSSTNSISNVQSNCPNGSTSQIGTGANMPCTYSASCDHGTHVAGIAAGNGAVVSPVRASGVAPGADVIGIQVFSRFNNASDCGNRPAPCALSYRSDQIRGLERVYALRNTAPRPVAANLSLGGGQYTAACDSESTTYKTAVDNLRSVGIATVVAAGNNGWSDAVSFPACISTTVTVGSTTKSDVVSSFSNSHPTMVDLYAPGSSIASSVPPSGYGTKSGTSMAAPQVAGSWAAMYDAVTSPSVSGIQASLRATGRTITDTRALPTHSHPRVRVFHGARIPAPNARFSGATSVSMDAPVQKVSTTEADIEPGELHPGGCTSTARTVWYRFTPTAGTRVTVDTLGSQSSFDTVLNVWRGTSLGALVGVTCDDDSAGSSKSRVTFDAVAGQTYYIQAGGDAQQFESSGMLNLNVSGTDHPLLTVAVAGDAAGTVTSTPAGIACGTVCSASYVGGTSVALTAQPGPGSDFTGWSGACSGAGGCTTSMTANRSVTAVFALRSHLLTVDKQGPGSGTITSTPGGIDCGPTCGAGFTHGSDVTLTAVAAADSELTDWGSDECPNPAATCTVSVTDARVLQPVFSAGRPDLVVTALSDPPAQHDDDSTWEVTDTTANHGDSAAAVSVTRFHLSPTPALGAGAIELSAGRSVPGLAPGASSSGTTTVVVPNRIPGGTYHLVACADGTGTVDETDDTNNCRASIRSVEVTGAPDLVVTEVANPPAAVEQGQAFEAADTTTNGGGTRADASRTRYYLSSDPVLDAGDRRLSGARPVPVLDAGGSSRGNRTVTVAPRTPTGRYHLIACADDTGLVPESDESNNCTATRRRLEVTPALPDLVIASVSNPPVSRNQGDSFPVTDTVANIDAGTAVRSSTSFHLSTDRVLDPGDLRLTGARAVPELRSGEASTGTTAITIPWSAPPGRYHIIACADRRSQVVERDEANNCRASTATLRVNRAWPDLVVAAVANPPASVTRSGTFEVSDSTANAGQNMAVASRTRYYLSVDRSFDTEDRRLIGARRVPRLSPGAGSSGSTTVTVPTGMRTGSYFLLACADDTSLVEESNEVNNCRASATRATVG
jgi:subtilase family serine protease